MIEAANLPIFSSQFGEDRLLSEYFKGKREGCCVEVGAYDGIIFSNTLYFEQTLGWKCILIEADPNIAEECKKNRPSAITVSAAAVATTEPALAKLEINTQDRMLSKLSSTSEVQPADSLYAYVKTDTLDKILSRCQIEKIDFITIDVEGAELAVLQGFSLSRWSPEIILVERNHRPDKSIMDLLHSHNYCFSKRTGCNDWFVRAKPRQASSLMYKAWLFAVLKLPKLIPFPECRLKKICRQLLLGR